MTLRLTSASQKQQDEPVKVSVWVLDDFQIHPHSDSGLCCSAIFMITITKSQNLFLFFLTFSLRWVKDLNRTKQNTEVEWICTLFYPHTSQVKLWKHIQTSTKAEVLPFLAKWKIRTFSFPAKHSTTAPKLTARMQTEPFIPAFINNQQANMISPSLKDIGNMKRNCRRPVVFSCNSVRWEPQ